MEKKLLPQFVSFVIFVRFVVRNSPHFLGAFGALDGSAVAFCNLPMAPRLQ
jgi:hypothetical protein